MSMSKFGSHGGPGRVRKGDVGTDIKVGCKIFKAINKEHYIN